MALSIRTTTFSILALAALLTVPVMVGVYVYRDSRRRGMSAVLWTLIAVAAPALIGFIIYLLIRGNYPDLQCPQCGGRVTEQYAVCPHCGAKLRLLCPNCSFPVERDWRVCPKCATPLDGAEMSFSPPLRRHDNTLSKILIAIVAVPVALILLAVVTFVGVSSSGGSAGALREVTFDEYDREQTSDTVREAVHTWLDGLEPRSDRAYALRYDYSSDLTSGDEHFFLFYIPDGGKSASRSFGIDSGLFGTKLELRLERTGYSGSLYCVQVTSDKAPVPRVYLGGSKVDCDVQVVDYNPTLFFIEPDYSREDPAGAELPERVTVIKLTGGGTVEAPGGTGSPGTASGSDNVGSVEVTDSDLMLKLLTAIDRSIRIPPDQVPDHDFTEGFEIVVEYEIGDSLISQPEMARHLVFMDGGACYLIDGRVTDSANGTAYRMMGDDFYGILEDLFQ